MATQIPTIRNPHNIAFSESETAILQRMFTGYQTIIIQTEYGGGFSGSRVLQIDPMLTERKTELPAVVKIASFFLTNQEYQAYCNCIQNRMPKVAKMVGDPVFSPDEQSGGIRYELAGEAKSFRVKGLGAYTADVETDKIELTLEQQLFRSLERGWLFDSRKPDFSLRDSYDLALPVNATIVPLPSIVSDEQIPMLSPDTSEAISLQREIFVCLHDFIVTEIDQQNQLVTLDLPANTLEQPANYRLRLEQVTDFSPFSLNQPITKIYGRVVETRTDFLNAQALIALEQTIDTTQANIPLNDQIWLTNPLHALPDILNMRLNVRVSCIHGDLNLANVLVDSDTGAVHLIDFGRTREDHILHDFLCLETSLMVDLFPAMLTETQASPAEALWAIYRQLHIAVRFPDNFIAPRLPDSALQKMWSILLTVRKRAARYLFDTEDWREYYLGLTLYLLGALKFRSLDKAPEAPLPKCLAFWGAAVAFNLFELIEAGQEPTPKAIFANDVIINLVNTYFAQGGQARERTDLDNQLERYLEWMVGQFSHIELRGIQREDRQVVRLSLEKIFVPLTAETHRNHRVERVSLNEILSLGQQIVVTGGPGSGKTTVLLHLAWLLAKALLKNDVQLVQGELGPTGTLILPIFVPLSAYTKYRSDVSGSADPQAKGLATFINFYLTGRQSNFDLPDDFFHCLLRDGQSIILLLDGLDEVPDENERAEVRQAVQDLVQGRNIWAVVTCRTVAYKDQALFGGDFCKVEVQPLDENHISQLVEQAYEEIFRHDALTKETQVSELIQAIQALENTRRKRLGTYAKALIDSPLLVRMLIIVHYSERRLPEQRIEVYMKAIDALLLPEHHPDAEIANQIGRAVGGNKTVHRELVQHLAFQMQERGEYQGRLIYEADLREILSTHPTYASLSEDLITLTRLRGTLLEERDNAYRFVHLAFQEFLTARYLAETLRDLEKIANFLEEGRINDSWWHEVAILVAAYLSVTNPPSAGDYIRRLANIDLAEGKRASQSPDIQLAALQVAGTATVEWPSAPSNLYPELAQRLVHFFKSPERLAQTQPTLRVAADHTLSQLDAPRLDAVSLDHIRFCYMSPGPFKMGDPECEDQDIGSINIPYGYWLSRFPITVAQFQTFIEANNYGLLAQRQWQEDKRNYPMRYVSWHDAMAFCRWLTKTWQEQNRLPQAWQVSLPSEAEWEKAARGGLYIPTNPAPISIRNIKTWQQTLSSTKNEAPQRAYPWGDQVDAKQANYQEAGIGNVSPVGCFPNGRSPYGCEEMSGNVSEWTRSLFQPYPYQYRDGREALESSDPRVLRGGAFDHFADFIGCAFRDDQEPTFASDHTGFRVALTPLNKG